MSVEKYLRLSQVYVSVLFPLSPSMDLILKGFLNSKQSSINAAHFSAFYVIHDSNSTFMIMLNVKDVFILILK